MKICWMMMNRLPERPFVVVHRVCGARIVFPVRIPRIVFESGYMGHTLVVGSHTIMLSATVVRDALKMFHTRIFLLLQVLHPLDSPATPTISSYHRSKPS